MPGGAIAVRRRASSNLLRRVRSLVPLWAVRTLIIALRHRRMSRRAASEPLADALFIRRGMPLLVADQEGRAACVACGLCAYACPTRCITVVPHDDPADVSSRSLRRFTLDMADCLLCGLCEEACPEEAIVMSGLEWRSLAGRTTSVFELHELLAPGARLSASGLHRERYTTQSTGTLPEAEVRA